MASDYAYGIRGLTHYSAYPVGHTTWEDEDGNSVTTIQMSDGSDCIEGEVVEEPGMRASSVVVNEFVGPQEAESQLVMDDDMEMTSTILIEDEGGMVCGSIEIPYNE